MKLRSLAALLCAVSTMRCCAAAESFSPIPWEDRVMPYAPHAECYLADAKGYHDASLDVRIETIRRNDTNVMLAYVTLQDASQFRTGTAATNFPSKRVAPVAALTKQFQAVLGINGDYFGYHTDGVVVRNGRVIRMKPNEGRDTLIVDANGDFTILSPTTEEAYAAFTGTVIHAFCFGPGLVVNGVPLTDLSTVRVDNGKTRKTQRIAIGQLGKLSYLIIATEGPENEGSVGFDLLQMAQLCAELKCVNAYNLDGGSSTSVVLDNKKINGLSSGKVRSVSDMIFFATLVP